MSQITTHVLDLAQGWPASGVRVVLEIEKAPGAWNELGRGATDGDGRLRHLLAPDALVEGTYRLTFDTGSYFESQHISGLYPRVAIEFQVRDLSGHYHIPLLLSPYGYSTYRGS